MRLRLALIGSLLLVSDATAQAVKPPEAPQAEAPAPAPVIATRAGDEAAIRAADEAFTKAFNAGDAQALALTFTEDAELIDEDNTVVEGREAIAAQLASALDANKGDKITLRNDTIKFVGADTALVRGRAEIVSAVGGGPEISRYTVVFVRQEGKWLQASVRDEFDQLATNAERLKALEWFVGDWISESADAVVSTTCEWTDNKNYLLRSFTVQVHGKPAMTGQQRIGWDPLTRQFKSWVFDSEGGYGEGLWTRDGDQWVIKAQGVRHDGKAASATQVITRDSKDVIRWKSIDRTVAGKMGADVDEFVLVRKPPKPR